MNLPHTLSRPAMLRKAGGGLGLLGLAGHAEGRRVAGVGGPPPAI